MESSMPREQRERYARAMTYAVVEKDLQLATADLFANWWYQIGHLLHDDVVDGFAQWTQGPQPRPELEQDKEVEE